MSPFYPYFWHSFPIWSKRMKQVSQVALCSNTSWRVNTVPWQTQQCEHTLKQLFQDGVNRKLKPTVPDLLRKCALELENSRTTWQPGWLSSSSKTENGSTDSPGRNANNLYKAHFFSPWTRLGDYPVNSAHMICNEPACWRVMSALCVFFWFPDDVWLCCCFRHADGTQPLVETSLAQHPSHIPSMGAETTRALFSLKPMLPVPGKLTSVQQSH